MKRTKDVIQWADNKGLLIEGNEVKQTLKCVSEVGELCDAIIKKDDQGIKDGIGDTLVTLIILCEQLGLTLEECLEIAWNEIKDRTGKTKEGIFIKNVNK